MGAVLYELLVGLPPFFTQNIQVLYKSIQKAKLEIPKVVSTEATDLLKKMLHKKPSSRITIDMIKEHAFFREIDWERLQNK